MSDVKERDRMRNANLGVSGAMPPSLTSPEEIPHVLSMDISDKSMSYYTQ